MGGTTSQRLLQCLLWWELHKKASRSSTKGGQLGPTSSLFLMLRCCSCFTNVHASLLLLLCCCSCFVTTLCASLLLFVLCCCSSCFIALDLLLFLLCFVVAPCVSLLLVLLHFVAPPSCIATTWCLVAPFPSQIPFWPLLFHYSSMFCASLFPCPNWYFHPPPFFLVYWIFKIVWEET